MGCLQTKEEAPQMWKLMPVKGVPLECFGNIHTTRGLEKTLQWLLEIAEFQKLQKIQKDPNIAQISPGSIQSGVRIKNSIFAPLPSDFVLS